MTQSSNASHSLGWFLGGLVVAMLGLSFASVPLYRIFCQKTGFGGTPKTTSVLPKRITERVLKVRFNADVTPHLPWHFQPLQKEVTLKIGALGLAFYEARNRSGKPIWGMATYNVTPEKAAPYFNKIECFCFKEQLLGAHQQMDMPVQFFIDPAFVDDPQLTEVSTITLSYTFFPLKS